MATGLTISSSSNMSTGQKILIAEAMNAFEPDAPDPDLVDVRRVPRGHKQIEIGINARLSQASALTEGADLAQSQQLVINYTQIVPTEHGVLVTLSDFLRETQGDQDVASTAGALMGMSLRNRLANDVIALYGGFSQASPGAGNALDVTHFRGAVAYIMTDNSSSYGPAKPPYIAALHIEQISDIILDITDPGAVVSSRFGLSAEMLQNWWKTRDRLYGVEVFHSGYISKDSNDDAIGFIGSGPGKNSGLVLGYGNDAIATKQRDESLRAEEFGLFQRWSEKEKVDSWGVEIISDAASTL